MQDPTRSFMHLYQPWKLPTFPGTILLEIKDFEYSPKACPCQAGRTDTSCRCASVLPSLLCRAGRSLLPARLSRAPRLAPRRDQGHLHSPRRLVSAVVACGMCGMCGSSKGHASRGYAIERRRSPQNSDHRRRALRY